MSRYRARRRFAVTLAACVAAGRISGATAETVGLASRDGITQPVVYTAANPAAASLVLLPGGNGVLGGLSGNFLVRVAPQFAGAGMNVAIADVPSDHPSGLNIQARSGEAQARDVTAIVAFLRSRSPAPVWLVGTSRGSISAANAARRLGPAQIAGVVLTSSVWSDGMDAVPLGQIAVPVLIVHNRNDACALAPFAGAADALLQLSRAPAKELIPVSSAGGSGPPCGAASPHGYLGAEAQTVAAITGWIRAHPAR